MTASRVWPRSAAAGVRVVWTSDLADIAGTHLHPRDVPGAIVSLDWADPPQSWRWAGPDWTGHAPPHRAEGLSGLTIEVNDPAGAAARWGAVLGLDVRDDGGTAVIALEHAGQDLRFVAAAEGHGEGITEVRLTTEDAAADTQIAGVRFVPSPKPSAGG